MQPRGAKEIDRLVDEAVVADRVTREKDLVDPRVAKIVDDRTQREDVRVCVGDQTDSQPAAPASLRRVERHVLEERRRDGKCGAEIALDDAARLLALIVEHDGLAQKPLVSMLGVTEAGALE